MIIVVAAPAAGEVVPVVDGPQVAVEALSWTWTAPWLNRSWNLTDLSSPVLKLRGATGTGQADPTHWWSEAPTIDGSQWEGARIGRGQVFLPLEVHAADSATFLVEHEAFMQSLKPRQQGVLRVSRPDGQWREIGCRYESGADLAIELDPVKSHRAVYGITWATPDPYWSGAPVSVTFVQPVATTFFPGPPFTIGAGSSLNSATVTNPGDEDAYPVWRITGPFTSFTVGVGAAVVSMTRTVTAGGWIEIDMTPRALTIVDNAGVDRWDDVTAVEFAPIPPGEVDLVTTMVGSFAGSAASLTFTPRYGRGW